MKHRRLSTNQAGFTIVELMIATAVLSIVLLLATVTITGIGTLYYKGFNQARIQNNARSTANEIAQQLELSSGFATDSDLTDAAKPVYAYCIGTTRYDALLNTQIGSGSSKSLHVLWRDTVAPGSCTALSAATMDLAQPTAGGTELIAPNSRLTAFSIDLDTPDIITIAEAYGDTDLLNLNGAATTCMGVTGEQFCATASLTTAVTPRLQTGP